MLIFLVKGLQDLVKGLQVNFNTVTWNSTIAS